MFALHEQYARKPAKILPSLVRLLPNEQMKSGFFTDCFRCRISDKEVIMQAKVVHDYSTVMRVKYALFKVHFGNFSTVVMLELCQS